MTDLEDSVACPTNFSEPANQSLRLHRASFFLTSTLLLAATSVSASEPSGGTIAALAGLGLALILLVLVVSLIFNAVFIHIAAGIMSLPNRRFGSAIVAALLGGVFSVVFSLMGGFAGAILTGSSYGDPSGLQTLISIICWVLPGTLAVKLAYTTDFGKAIATYIISFILTLVVAAGFVFAILAIGIAGSPTP